jgi:hypothetical protein
MLFQVSENIRQYHGFMFKMSEILSGMSYREEKRQGVLERDSLPRRTALG